MNRRRFARRPARSAALRRQLVWSSLLAAMPSGWSSLIGVEAPMVARVNARRAVLEVQLYRSLAEILRGYPVRWITPMPSDRVQGMEISGAWVDEVTPDLIELQDKVNATILRRRALEGLHFRSAWVDEVHDWPDGPRS